jgi:aminoglycoside phosphotransferase (APT) family kinase protein
VWAHAEAAPFEGDPVWFHGDVAMTNLLVRDGRLAAVLDFGSSGVGDPACDVVVAWTALGGESRRRFRAELGADAGTWSRGRGWALWKALITLRGDLERDAPAAAAEQRRVIGEVLADFAAGD